MAPVNLAEIKIEDIDFDKVKECRDKNVLKRYIQLLTEDGCYFEDLLKAVKEKLLEVAPKEYYLLYPKQASDQEVQDARRDLLEWEAGVHEIDKALKSSTKDRIFDDPNATVRAPIRGQEASVARPNLQGAREPSHRELLNNPKNKDDVYARDKSNMKDYYRAWDGVDVDKLEEELDEEERAAEEARRKHFEDLKDEQDKAKAWGPIEIGEPLPAGMPEAHRKHMADSEKEKGNEAFYSKDYEEAEAYYSRSIKYRSDDPSTWANRALVRLKLERASEALADCDRSLALNERYMKALHRKGKALHELGRYEEAVKFFQLALAESPGNTQINGDLMVARRRLRSTGGAEPPKEEKKFNPPPRRVDAAPTCTIEEVVEDETAGGGGSSAGAGYTRVVIEEASDSEDEGQDLVKTPSPEAVAPATSSSAPTGGFRKVPIVEDSDSEEEDKAAPSAAPASSAAAAAGFKKIAIVEESDSEDEPAAQPKAEAPAAAGGTAAAAVCFDDMD